MTSALGSGKRSTMIRFIFAFATALLLTACGKPEVGESCSPEGGAACDDANTALECREGVFRIVACRGPGGCSVTKDATVCDFSQAQAGDACFESSEGRSLCDPRDTNEALRCEGGFFVAYPCPNGCSVTQGNVFCH